MSGHRTDRERILDMEMIKQSAVTDNVGDVFPVRPRQPAQSRLNGSMAVSQLVSSVGFLVWV